ncbi:class I adenylate-forming enzyme family protein [Streptomyces rubrogriseus]|uniref:class I adenylate-forming enzyme family protein n=1 Tax=Streptomyces rubrogriseus TaxID=194673 RepID=UPI003828C617
MTLVTDLFDRGWKIAPDSVAYVKGERTWTYDEAGRRSCAIAHRLLAQGFPSGSKFGVLAPNDPEGWIIVLGLWRAGMVWIPMNPASPPETLANLFTGFDGDGIFFHESLAEKFAAMQESAGTEMFSLAFGPTRPGLPGLAEWIEDACDHRPELEADPDDVVAIFPTGGTTGSPKGVMNTHRSFSITFAHILLAFPYEPDRPPVNLAAAPLTHSSGMLSLVTSAQGGKVVVLERAEPRAILQAIEDHSVTEVFLPPTVIYRLLEQPDLTERDLSSLRYLIYSSAPMSVEKLKKALTVFGPVLTESYGQVEAFAGISFLQPSEHFQDGVPRTDGRLASCGRPYPFVRVEIRRDGQTMRAHETGEICVKGDLVMKGYYGNPEATAEALKDGWLHTGDVGHMDEHGYLYITDRAKDVVISGGLNVYPTEVEQVLWSHAAVQDCAVVGAPHPDWGEELVAVVELNDGMSVSAKELIALCKRRLGSYKAPKRVEFVGDLPRSVNGKVLRREVRQSFWRGHERSI